MLFVKSLAQELAPHRIRVNSLCPGAIRTPINTAAWSTPKTLFPGFSTNGWHETRIFETGNAGARRREATPSRWAGSLRRTAPYIPSPIT